MADLAALLSDAILPNTNSLNSVFAGALGAAGFRLNDDPEYLAKAQILHDLPEAKKVLVILVDGFGAMQFHDYRGYLPTLRNFSRISELTTVVPSTTSTAITAFGTGATAGATGVAGYSVKSPYTEKVFNLISWEGAGTSIENWQTVPTLFERLGSEGKNTCIVQAPKYLNSGLSRAALRGTTIEVHPEQDQRLFLGAKWLANRDSGVVYVHWKDVDASGHKFGVGSDQWLAAIEEFDAVLKRALKIVPAGTLILVTADHGMINAGEKLDLADSTVLNEGVLEVAGEERALHLYTEAFRADDVAQRYRDELGERAWVLTRNELAESGIVGDINKSHLLVFGDVIVFSRKNYGIVDSRRQTESAIALKGVHGSLTAQEMYIPMLVEVK
ncbi:MAG: alkaline phosphatase family protein [Arcanobacterium sp.]|nr:alkaline phosphatase family protein [Arcanobacterium sp.]